MALSAGWSPRVAAMLVAAVLLLSVSALLAGTETALFSLTRADVRYLRRGSSAACRALFALHRQGTELQPAFLLAGATVGLCFVLTVMAVADTLCGPQLHTAALSCGAGVAFVSLLLFGGVLPRALAGATPVRFACFAVRAVAPLLRLFAPPARRLFRGAPAFRRLSRRSEPLSLDELADAVDRTQTASHEEHEMLTGIVGFVNTEAVEIMRPRVDVTAVSLADGYDCVKEVIVRSGYSRIPVYEGELDNIRGMLYVKDLLPHIDCDDTFGWQRLIRKPYFVPENRKISDLLEDFRANQVHVAIVVDEYGSTLGLVSLEDIIEEIVGEITDESDGDESFYRRLGEGVYLFDGKTHIGDFERVLGLGEDALADVRGEAETLGGLILELRGDFPFAGEHFTTHGIRFTVERLDGCRIDRLKVELLKRKTGDEGN